MCAICQAHYDEDHEELLGPLCPSCGRFHMGVEWARLTSHRLSEVLPHTICSSLRWEDRCSECQASTFKGGDVDGWITEGQGQSCYHCFGAVAELDPCTTCTALSN